MPPSPSSSTSLRTRVIAFTAVAALCILGGGAYVTAAGANDDLIVLGGYLNRGQAVAFWVIGR